MNDIEKLENIKDLSTRDTDSQIPFLQGKLDGRDIVIKCLDNTYEPRVCKEVINRIIEEKYSPNFIKCLDVWRYDAKVLNKYLKERLGVDRYNDAFEYSSGHDNGYYILLVLELIDDANSLKSTYQSMTDRDKSTVLFQLVYSLAVIERFRTSHNDLHTGNVIIRKESEPKDRIFVVETEAGRILYRITTDIIPYLFDWDMSYCEFLGPNGIDVNVSLWTAMYNDVRPHNDLLALLNNLTRNNYYKLPVEKLDILVKSETLKFANVTYGITITVKECGKVDSFKKIEISAYQSVFLPTPQELDDLCETIRARGGKIKIEEEKFSGDKDVKIMIFKEYDFVRFFYALEVGKDTVEKIKKYFNKGSETFTNMSTMKRIIRPIYYLTSRQLCEVFGEEYVTNSVIFNDADYAYIDVIGDRYIKLFKNYNNRGNTQIKSLKTPDEIICSDVFDMYRIDKIPEAFPEEEIYTLKLDIPFYNDKEKMNEVLNYLYERVEYKEGDVYPECSEKDAVYFRKVYNTYERFFKEKYGSVNIFIYRNKNGELRYDVDMCTLPPLNLGVLITQNEKNKNFKGRLQT